MLNFRHLAKLLFSWLLQSTWVVCLVLSFSIFSPSSFGSICLDWFLSMGPLGIVQSLMGTGLREDRLSVWMRTEMNARAVAALGGRTIDSVRLNALMASLEILPQNNSNWISRKAELLKDVFASDELWRLAEQGVIHDFSHSELEAFLRAADARSSSIVPIAPPLEFRSPLSQDQWRELAGALPPLLSPHLDPAFDNLRVDLNLRPEQVRARQRSVEQALTDWGGTFRRVDHSQGQTRIAELQFAAESTARTRVPSFDTDAFLFEITGSTQDTVAASFSAPALRHPELASVLRFLHQHDIRLMVDPTLEFVGISRGYFSPRRRFIALEPDSSWVTLLHELEHAKNFIYVFPEANMDRIHEVLRTGEIEVSDPTERWRVARAAALASQGLAKKTIDEVLVAEALDRQFEAAGLRELDPIRLRARLLGALVVWRDLGELDTLTDSQRAARSEAQQLARELAAYRDQIRGFLDNTDSP